MNPISEQQLLAVIATLPVSTEHFDDGALRFQLHRSRSSRDVVIADLGALAFSTAYLVGREEQPTLRGTSFDASDPVAAALAEHRALQLDTAAELYSAVSHLARLGWCVDNDAYIFDAEGRWMLYVSHHDSVWLYEQ